MTEWLIGELNCWWYRSDSKVKKIQLDARSCRVSVPIRFVPFRFLRELLHGVSIS